MKNFFRADDFKINGGNSIDCFITDNDPFKFNAGQVLEVLHCVLTLGIIHFNIQLKWSSNNLSAIPNWVTTQKEEVNLQRQ